MNLPRLKSPVVLIHGLFGFCRLRLGRLSVDYFHGIPRALEAAGNRVLLASVSPSGGIAERAGHLADFLQRHLKGEPAHLIGHSMGGLDARYAISRLGQAPRVLSLMTLGSPHRGSPFADWLERRLTRLADPIFRFLGLPTGGFYDLTTAAMARFNSEVPDVPGVRYFSVAGDWPYRWNNPHWYISSRVIEKAEGPNDGLVSQQSARWGEFLGVWPGDHLNLANWPEAGLSRHQNDRMPEYATLLGRLRDEGY